MSLRQNTSEDRDVPLLVVLQQFEIKQNYVPILGRLQRSHRTFSFPLIIYAIIHVNEGDNGPY